MTLSETKAEIEIERLTRMLNGANVTIEWYRSRDADNDLALKWRERAETAEHKLKQIAIDGLDWIEKGAQRLADAMKKEGLQ